MGELLHTTETSFGTDFAILNAAQVPIAQAKPGSFAGSAVGGLSALCGTKYARVHVRAERWSGPPEVDDSWEDRDELPFVAAADGGLLRVWGFDPATEDHGLDLEGFGNGRVRVLARGRHRYYYSDVFDDLPAEEWLLQFFPTEGVPDPLAGPPRCLPRFAPFGPRDIQPGWFAALHSWVQTGWQFSLSSSPAYLAVQRGMHRAGRPVSEQDLARSMRPSVSGSVPGSEDPLEEPLAAGAEDPLVALAATPITTVRDAIAAMRELQLLLEVRRGSDILLVPNPAPGPIWEKKVMTDREVRGLQLQIGYADFRLIGDDIVTAVSWAGDRGLTTTVQEMGIRWSATSAEIRGGLALGALTSGLATTPALDSESSDDDQLPIVVTKTGYWSV